MLPFFSCFFGCCCFPLPPPLGGAVSLPFLLWEGAAFSPPLLLSAGTTPPFLLWRCLSPPLHGPVFPFPSLGEGCCLTFLSLGVRLPPIHLSRGVALRLPAPLSPSSPLLLPFGWCCRFPSSLLSFCVVPLPSCGWWCFSPRSLEWCCLLLTSCGCDLFDKGTETETNDRQVFGTGTTFSFAERSFYSTRKLFIICFLKREPKEPWFFIVFLTK